MIACEGPQSTVRDSDLDSALSAASFLGYLYIVSQANDSLRLAHTLPPQLKLCALLSATTEFTNCSTPKPKVHRMRYDCFRPKPNVRRKCPFVHIRRRNRNRNRNSVALYSSLARIDFSKSTCSIVMKSGRECSQSVQDFTGRF